MTGVLITVVMLTVFSLIFLVLYVALIWTKQYKGMNKWVFAYITVGTALLVITTAGSLICLYRLT